MSFHDHGMTQQMSLTNMTQFAHDHDLVSPRTFVSHHLRHREKDGAHFRWKVQEDTPYPEHTMCRVEWIEDGSPSDIPRLTEDGMLPVTLEGSAANFPPPAEAPREVEKIGQCDWARNN